MTRRRLPMPPQVSLGLVLTALVAGLLPLRGQEPPLPDAEPFFAAVKANLTRADKEQFRYAYRERRSEVHTNPFGKIGTGGSLVYRVTPGAEYGVYQKLLVERDGKAVNGVKAETVDRRGQSLANPSVTDVVETLQFRIVKRERIEGRDLIRISFAARPNARPKTRPGKMAKAFRGDVWVDERANEVARLEATAVESLGYGFGLVARLNQGATVHVEREPVDAIWLPTSIRLRGGGRALVVRKLDVDYAIEWFDYRRAQQ